MDEKLHAMRHSAAHVLAAAVAELYPGAQFGVGPVVDDGFYYDILTPQPVTEDDFGKIEQKMREIINRGEEFRREDMPIGDAITFFQERNQPFKVALLTALKEKGTTAIRPEEAGDIAGADSASVYYTGAFVDLCRGPHVANSKEIGAFKLAKLAGAYWRGDDKNPQLQRVYGYCFATKEDLDAHLFMLEEAKKRDHRKLGKELGLFTFSELVGPGLPLWTPKGTMMRELLNDYVWALRKKHGYQKVTIPHITKKDLYETSGHWAKYAADLFKVTTREGHEFAMKPMNCPHHAQIFDSEPRSYRDMPVRYCETTMVYRDEQSGELSGLSRVLSITQDDAHVFCRLNQVREEAEKVWDIIETFYKTFGFNLVPRLSRRDAKQAADYMGEPADWDQAEAALKEILDAHKVEWIDGPGEAAFYGPKIDFMAKDSLGRTWQVATIQLDFNQPRNFGLTCVNEQGEKEPVVMIHCAIMGSLERCMSVLIEHYAGAFPLWLAPEQIRLATVSDDFVPFAKELQGNLAQAGLRVSVDDSSEKLGKKIRNAAMSKIPWTVVIGAKEAEGGDIKVNVFGQEEDLVIPQADFVAKAADAGKMPV